jgi:hypothetical protein
MSFPPGDIKKERDFMGYARRSRGKAYANFNRLSAKAFQTLTCVGAVLRRRSSFHNPRIRRSSSSAAAKMACRSSLAMWIRWRRPREARRRAGTTRRTRKGPRLPVRRCRWRKRRDSVACPLQWPAKPPSAGLSAGQSRIARNKRHSFGTP